ncbi:MAG: hypothetical protein WA906_06915 [Pacificimonas sp.]
MPKPPKTPPDSKPEKAAPKSEELKREEDAPIETKTEMAAKEKGYPKGSKTPWN